MSDACEHGSLRRKCDICDLQAHIEELRSDLDTANLEIRRLTRERAEVAAELGLWKQAAQVNVQDLAEARQDVDRLRAELETLAEEYRTVRRFGCDGSGGEWTRETVGYYFWARARAALSGGE